MNGYHIYIAGVLLLWGCHGRPSASTASNTMPVADTIQRSQAKSTPLEKGMVIDTVKCINDSSQRYAIYIPTHYAPDKKWPIIYFFDPHGAGDLPLNIYKGLAEKYGFIIAGTYGSKNGMQWEASDRAAQAFIQDTRQRLSIDDNRLNTFGFSGGARVACSVALYDGGIAGVVACGGGFPQNNPQINNPFSIISFVGDKDFNNIELKQLDRELDKTPLNHQLMVFHGKHQWPPVTDIEQAFQWLELSAMRTKAISPNDSLVNAVKQEFVKEYDKWERQNNSVQEYFTCKKMLNFLRGLTDVDKYAAKLQELQNSDKIVKYLQDEQTSEMEEAQIQQDLIQDLSNKDDAWWQGTVKEMRSFIEKDSLSPVALQNQRMLSFLSLVIYMGASHAFGSMNDEATAHFLNLYALVDPKNPEHSYLYACLYARENNQAKTMSSLRDAVKLGFNDARRMQDDTNFVALRQQEEFKALVKKVSAMPHKMDVTQ